MFALVAYGLVLGAQAAQHGMRLWEVPLMTGLNYAGGSEFAAIALWAAPPPVLLIIAITLLINSRHVIMGAALAPYLARLPRRRALALLFLMSDESWALSFADTQKRAASGQAPAFSPFHYLGLGLAIWGGWVAATGIGAAFGPLLGDVSAIGADMAFPAVFLVILAGLWKRETAWPWAASLVAACLVHLFVPGPWHVLAGAGAGIAVAAWRA